MPVPAVNVGRPGGGGRHAAGRHPAHPAEDLGGDPAGAEEESTGARPPAPTARMRPGR